MCIHTPAECFARPIVAGKGIGLPPADVVTERPFRSRISTKRAPRRELFGRVAK